MAFQVEIMKWRDFFLKDWHLKLVSLGFSILLWSLVVGQEKAEIGLSIPLEIVNLPNNLVIANDIPSSIEVRVFGPRSIIKNIAGQNLTKVIDLKNASVGKMVIHFSTDDFSLPGGVKVLRIKPSIVTIDIQPLLRKSVIVKPVIENKPAPGYEIERVDVQPITTQISGPANVVKKIKRLDLMPVSVKDIKETITAITTPDTQKYRISIEGASKFKVTVHIKPKQGERKITHVPIRLIQGEHLVSIWPTEVSVRLCGEIPSLNSLKIKDINVTLDVSGLKPGSYKLEPDVSIPPVFKCLKVSPKKISVWVKRGKRKK